MKKARLMVGPSQNGLTPAVTLTPLEVAVSRPLGLERGAQPLSVSRSSLRDPVNAMEDVLVEALSRPPCLLSFSGGRDSSGLLALATKLSREQGLELPIPATMLFPGDAAANEDEWQAVVLKELGLPDWVRINVTPGELDIVGPVAATALKRHGLLWPFNAHFHLPIIERAAGGSLVTGFGGDEIALVSRSARAERLLARQDRTGLARSIATVGFALSPWWVREAVYRHRYEENFPWLTRRGHGMARRAIAHDSATDPFGFDRKLQGTWCSRYWQLSLASYKALGAPCDVRVFHPFADGRVLEALAATGGIPGFGNRRALVHRLFGGIMPEAVIERSSKAHLTDQFWTSTATEFARTWSGEGTDGDIVDPDRLRADWLKKNGSRVSVTLLQAAWLHDQGLSGPEARGQLERTAG